MPSRPRMPTATEIERQAVAMFAELEARWPGGTDRLATETVDRLTGWDQVDVRLVPEFASDAGCTVTGAYLNDAGSAIIAIAQSASPGRRAFTAGHELGHHLQQTTEHLVEALLDEVVDGQVLEEAACDSFAARLLIPGHLTTRHIGPAGPTAHDIVSLWRDGQASRQAVCARAADQLPAPGHVLLLDAAGLITFASSRGEPPLARGSDQSVIPVVADQLRTGGAHSGRTRIAYRDGIAGSELYAQTADLGGYTVVVAVTDRAPWLGFSPPSRTTGPTRSWWVCSHCGAEFQTWDRGCRKCAVPKCPDCRRCECPPTNEHRCDGCFQLKPDHMFDTDPHLCRDCT